MANIKLTYHRIVQRNVGTWVRPEYIHSERPTVISCSIPRMYERDPSQPVHLRKAGALMSERCEACNVGPQVWTDDTELWERHPARCNYAYTP